ncbi:hypothetical protein [Peribacillus acanthi]|uniref:hypothetical protein n=1 Tax=Peribacillus acanthi TaxID=2171554 RepID=UPI000D3E679F|nr:hypothetical protein [Peribacillus acanthi]
MINLTNVNLSKKDHALSEREVRIIEVLLLNLCAQSNASVTKENAALNPVAKDVEDVFNINMVFQNPISLEKGTELKETIERRIGNALKMSGLEGFDLVVSEQRAGELKSHS